MDKETRKIRARAEAIQLAIDRRRWKPVLPVVDKIEVAPQLEREAARVAMEILLDDGLGLAPLLDRLEELGKLRAAMQVLQDAGLKDAAEKAKSRFDEKWQELDKTDPEFFAEPSKELLGQVGAVVQLLRQATSEGDQTRN